jgi:hypothetical protein
MTTQRVVWTVVEREASLRGAEVLSIGIRLFYPDRECDLHIVPAPPLVGEIPEKEAVMDEFRRIRDALDRILSEEKP